MSLRGRIEGKRARGQQSASYLDRIKDVTRTETTAAVFAIIRGSRTGSPKRTLRMARKQNNAIISLFFAYLINCSLSFVKLKKKNKKQGKCFSYALKETNISQCLNT